MADKIERLSAFLRAAKNHYNHAYGGRDQYKIPTIKQFLCDRIDDIETDCLDESHYIERWG